MQDLPELFPEMPHDPEAELDDAARQRQAVWLAVWWFTKLKLKMKRNLTEQTTSYCYYRMVYRLARVNDPEWTETKAPRTLNLKRARHSTSAHPKRDAPWKLRGWSFCIYCRVPWGVEPIEEDWG